jgi:uncharacterized protein YutE (UPF0331/DUF86 family)
MYFVDRDKIEERLYFIETMLGTFTEMIKWSSEVEKLAGERIIHMVIESMLDIGNSLIDGFIMRDPGSYEDIIDILEDESVITKEMNESYKRVLPLRKLLIQDYHKVNHEDLHDVFSKEWKQLTDFAPKVRMYMENELGPVTTFIS